jgi:hypothetical protein
MIAAGCGENEMLSYENEPAVYFAHETYGQRDSISHSFFLLNTTILSDTVYIKVNTMGQISSQDRPISLIQTNVGKPEAAVAGKHYVSFDDAGMKERLWIPANSAEANIPIVFIRDPSLALGQIRLELAIEKNEYFRPGIDAWRTFIVTTTDQAVRPALWDTRWRTFFGSTWGSIKMRFIIDATGYTEWGVTPSDMSYLTFLRNTVLQKFDEYNAAHPDEPLKEADGELVRFN